MSASSIQLEAEAATVSSFEANETAPESSPEPGGFRRGGMGDGSVRRPAAGLVLLDHKRSQRQAEGVVGPVAQIISAFSSQCARGSDFVAAPLRMAGGSTELPAYIYRGSGGGGDPIRIALFAGIHGDEPAGSFALARFAEWLLTHPEAGEGYELYFYPVCNPSGLASGRRNSSSGKDLNREFWRGSEEPEVRSLEQEIRSRSFHGLVSLHSDDTSSGMYGYVRGAVLSRGLLEPALEAAEQILPRNTSSIIDGFPAQNGIISQCFDGILTSPPNLQPLPFEIILETPQSAPMNKQEEAFLAALSRILLEYRKLLSFAADL